MANFSLSTQSGLFLTKFQGRSANMYNSANVLEGRIKKKYNFVGKQMNIETQLSFSGSVGAKLLPVGNASNVQQAVITAKKEYARVFVDRESLKAASSTEGAFQKYLAFPVKKTVESYLRNSSRVLFGDGSGILGRGDAATNVSGAGSVGSPYVITISAASWNEANWEERDFVQIVTGLGAFPVNTGGVAEGGDAVTNLLEISAVNPSLRQISLVGTSAVLAALTGVGPVLATTGLCMQRSYLAEPQGLGGALLASSGTLYGLPVARRWQATQVAAGGAGIITDMMNEVMLKTEKAFGQAPKMIVMNYNQLQKILAQLEDQKVYQLPNRNLKGSLSFSGVEFMSTRGPIPMFVDRFADEDKLYFLNDDFIERIHRPDFGWFTDDNTTFLRVADSDEYEARYGGYYENFITPTAHGILTGLAK